MSEAYLSIDFDCKTEHAAHWNVALGLLADGVFNWKFQDALDPISKLSSDALDDVWDNLSYGNDSFEVFEFKMKGNHCHLKLMTGGVVFAELVEYLIAWFKSFPVDDFYYSVSIDDE